MLIGSRPKVELAGQRTLVCGSPMGITNLSPPEQRKVYEDARRSWLRRFFKKPFHKPVFDPKLFALKGSEALVTQQAAGTLQNTYTTAKSVINPQALFQIPAGDNFWYIGKTLRITVAGGLSNIVTTPGTIVMQVMMGTIVVFTTGNIQLNATAHTLLPFWLDVILTCQVLGNGTNAKLMGMGRLQGLQPTLTAAQTDAVNTGGIFSAPASAPAQGGGFDSTIANNIDFWTGFSISNAGNGIQVQLYIVEALN